MNLQLPEVKVKDMSSSMFDRTSFINDNKELVILVLRLISAPIVVVKALMMALM